MSDLAAAATTASTPATATSSQSPSASSSSLPPPLPSSSTSSSFVFPHYYHFPPMFTLQPNLATRRAQLDKWSALVLAYCRHYRVFRLALGTPPPSSVADKPGPVRVDSEGQDSGGEHSHDGSDTPASIPYYAPDLFANRALDRALAAEGVRAVVAALRKEGRAEWYGGGGTGSSPESAESAYIYWKTPDEWAALVEAYVDETAQRGSVLTLYELTAGEGTRGTELHGLDPGVLQQALAVLVKRGKAQVFGAQESLGVKFF